MKHFISIWRVKLQQKVWHLHLKAHLCISDNVMLHTVTGDVPPKKCAFSSSDEYIRHCYTCQGSRVLVQIVQMRHIRERKGGKKKQDEGDRDGK